MKHLFKTAAIFLALLSISVCNAFAISGSNDDSFIKYVRANVTPGTWESFCLPMQVSTQELALYFDKVYITATDEDELILDNAGGQHADAPHRVTALPDPLPEGSFGFSQPGSNYYHLFFCDIIGLQASISSGVPFFGHVREGVEGGITIHGEASSNEDEQVSFSKKIPMYSDKELRKLWSEEELFVSSVGLTSEEETIDDEGLTYFEMSPEGGFSRIETSEVEAGHAYIACTADSRTKIVTYSLSLDELLAIESVRSLVVDYLDLDDAATDLLYGDYQPGNITYVRDEAVGNYATFCMPFDFRLGETTGICDIYFIHPFALYNEDTERMRLFFYSVDDIDYFDGYILAGEPFVALVDGPVEFRNCIPTHYNEQSRKNIYYEDVVVYNWNETGGFTPRNRDIEVTFTGTLEETSYESEGVEGSFIKFFNGEGGVINLSSSESVPAFRSILTVETFGSNGVRAIDTSFRDYDDDETTDIRNLLISSSLGRRNSVYSVDGRLVSTDAKMDNLQPGVYIVNGKKIVKK